MVQNILELDKLKPNIPTKEEIEKAKQALIISTRISEKVAFYRKKHEADENK